MATHSIASQDRSASSGPTDRVTRTGWTHPKCALCAVITLVMILGGLILVVLSARDQGASLIGSGGSQLTVEWRQVGFALIALALVIGPVSVMGARTLHAEPAD